VLSESLQSNSGPSKKEYATMSGRYLVTALLFAAVTVATVALGSDSKIVQQSRDTPWFLKSHSLTSSLMSPLQRDNNQQEVIAYGTHQCQSEKSIGHTCKVSSLVTDCAEAYAVLKRQDCCGTTKEGGQSIGFTLGNCGAYAQP
jgi:hypothetical protein